MRKRRRNITIVNNEIDYEKLAEAIVKANEKVENTKQKSSKVLTATMAMFLALVFGLFGVGLCFFAVAAIVSYFQLIPTITDVQLNGLNKLSFQILIWMLIFIMFFTGIIMIVSAIEIYREKDRNFIMSAFSGVVGFAALIVALVTLL